MDYPCQSPIHCIAATRGAPSCSQILFERVEANRAVRTVGLYLSRISSPTPALANTSRAGLTLYRSSISRTATASPAVYTPPIAPFARLNNRPATAQWTHV